MDADRLALMIPIVSVVTIFAYLAWLAYLKHQREIALIRSGYYDRKPTQGIPPYQSQPDNKNGQS